MWLSASYYFDVTHIYYSEYKLIRLGLLGSTKMGLIELVLIGRPNYIVIEFLEPTPAGLYSGSVTQRS